LTGAGTSALRPATTTDLDALLGIERAVFPRPWSAASFRGELARPDRVWLVAAPAGTVVGFGGVADLAGEAHVLSVAVADRHRRQGHARALVVALLTAARERFGADRATLEVRASNTAARALYRSCGFVEAGVRPGYYQDDREDAVVLWCDDVLAALGGTAPGRPPPPSDHEPPDPPTPGTPPTPATAPDPCEDPL
jgi:[ribosomal protein S18]-alanine N-acetyltransferase